MAKSGLFSVCLIIPAVAAFALRIGILLCEEHCHHLKGCRGIGFVKEDLQCQLLTEEPVGALQAHSVTKRVQSFCSSQACSVGGRCIKNRERTDICVRPTGHSINKRKVKREDPRLFILPNFLSKATRFRQMNLRSREIHEYKHLSLASVSAACYMGIAKRLLTSSRQFAVLLSHQVDTNNTHVMRENVTYYGLVVDEAEKFLFGYVSLMKRELIRLPLAGGNDTRLQFSSYGYGPHGLTLDKVNKLVYATFTFAIVSFSYDGKRSKKVMGVKVARSLTLDPIGGDLYYAGLSLIFRRNLSHTDPYKIAELSAKPGILQYFNNSLYVSNSDRKSDTPLFIIDLQNGSVNIPVIKSADYESCFIICLAV